MARDFGTTGILTFGPGNASGTNRNITIIAAIKITDVNGGIIQGRNSTTVRWSFLFDAQTLFGNNEFDNGMNADLTLNTWYTVAISKGSGSVPYHFSWKPIGSGSWSHTTATDNIANGTANITNIRLGVAENSGNVHIAAIAIFSGGLSDASVDALGSDSAVTWKNNTPLWMVQLNQASTATNVLDLMSGHGDQTAITGTSVVSDPAGFTYYTPNVTGVLAGDLGAMTNTITGKVVVPATLAGDLGALNGTIVGSPTLYGVLSGDLGGLSATAVGSPTLYGVLDGSLGSLNGTILGTPKVFGVLSAPLGELSGTITSGGNVIGTAVSDLGALSGTLLGTPEVNGVLLGSLGSLDSTILGKVTVPGVLLGNLGALSGTILGTRETSGSFEALLGTLDATALGHVPHIISGVLATDLGLLEAGLIGGGRMANLITIDDIATALGRDPYDEIEEAEWLHYIVVSSNYINAKVRYGFQNVTVTALYQADAYGQVYLREPVTDLASITNFRTGESDPYADWDGVNKIFYLEPHQTVRVTYSYGYEDVPDDIKDLATSLVLVSLQEDTSPGLSKYKVGDLEEGYRAGPSRQILDEMTKDVLDNYRRSFYSIPLTLDIFPDYRSQGYVDDFD